MLTRIKLPFLLIFWLTGFSTLGQKQIRGHLKTVDSMEFTIINVLPDSFPTVSVIFKGYKANGDPLWNLKREDFRVTENGVDSNIISLVPISRNKPINIGVVIDHSGSMSEDYSFLFDKNGNLISYDTVTFAPIFPKDYMSPIDNAKATTKEFAKSFNSQKDLISVIGFSSRVDKVLPLTNNREKIDSVINSMQSDSATALYDGMLTGLNQLSGSDGVNVLVTLTDGLNNKSRSSWKEVTEKAEYLDIPIYIIGLGNVNKDTLQMIADLTNGQFIYTRTSDSFRQIYSRISKEIQSFYDLKYVSGNVAAMEAKRNLTITFLPNGTKSDTLNYAFALPDEVMSYLKNKAKKMDYIIGTSTVTAVALTIGTILYRRRWSKRRIR